ncbi:ribosome biogenesis GTPase YqeH [Leuconostoc falkenbergense]|uniref:ribosome biogenesis GTPase YqeH n=1 Tax=Leuconostoc falkenbergense TaxID=2766470 RepID=UPI0024A8BC20|nr:ribosome biogenesis GTPase YqeH [Leuconostoc falkenbergense]MDI6553534.1 ribosome biogenesis GTPase YqeH [Leuconostoc falkenbergense]
MTTEITDDYVQEQLNEGLRCIGCGALMQTTDPRRAGYLPLSALKKAIDSDALFCQRCFRLRHYNEIQPVELTDDDFARLLHQISETKALIVYVLDLFDVTGSEIAGLPRFVGENNPILVVGNKVDLLPKLLNQNRLKQWLQTMLKAQGIKPADIFLTSAAHPNNIDVLLERVDQLRLNRDVYVVGVTNVGKSTLINQIIKSRTGIQDLITTSRFPGTTLDRIEIPLADGHQLIDTPGIIKREQMAHVIADKDLKYALPKKEIKPRTYQLNPEQTLFLGGMARFDFVSGERTAVTAYFENNLNIHRTKLNGADEFYNRHVGELLTPAPLNLTTSPLVKREFNIIEKSDLVFAGLGWITLPAGIKVAGWVPEGVDVLIRKAMI